MRDKRALAWRSPAWLALFGLSALLVWLAGVGEASAGSASGSVTISPLNASVGAGGTAAVDLVAEPPAGGLAIWIVEVGFDTTVVQVEETQAGFNCVPGDLPPAEAKASLCDGKNTDGDPEPDAAVSIGAFLRNDGGNPVGLTSTTTLATIHFEAVGEVGECSDLIITIAPGNFLPPDGTEVTPDVINGEICITPGQTLLWGDVNCSGSVDPIDGLFILRADAGLETDTGSCPDMGEMVTVNGHTIPWGDLNCNESGDPIDGLLVLRHDAGLSAETGDCPDLGTNASVS